MFRIFNLSILIAVVLVCSSVSADWPRFRGPNGTGIAESGAPTKFGEKENLRWVVELPGRGVSSPIVVGDKLFVTCYSGYGTGEADQKIEDLRRHLICVNRKSGDRLWTKTVAVKLPEDSIDGNISAHGYASHTPVSDGKHVFAFFGKSGVYAYDLDGNEIWNQGVGTESGPQRWGSSASPVLTDEFVIVTASDESESLIWLDKKTGEEKHRAEAAGLSNVWGTPIFMETKNGKEVVLSASDEIWGLDATNGKFLWYALGGSDGPRASVVAADGIVYAMANRGGSAVAVEAGGKGDVTDSNTLWVGRTQSPYATPLLHDGHLYCVNSSAFVCMDIKTGKTVFQNRLSTGESVDADGGGGGGGGGNRNRGGGGGGGGRGRGGQPGNRGDYASPVLADGKIYVTTDSGTVYVLAAKPEFKLLATNDMTFDASGFGGTPAISDGQLFLRSHTHLYCIGKE